MTRLGFVLSSAFIAGLSQRAASQQPTPPTGQAAPQKVLSAPPAGRSITRAAPSLVQFFAGAWRCDGAFPNGKAIHQSMEFHEILGGAWLSAAHDDELPGTYHAAALWGSAPNNALVANIADNQGGMRRFVAADGWTNNRVAFVRDTIYANFGHYGERFTYERQADSAFRMTYETMRDTVPWHEGDHVICTRAAGK